MEKYYERISPDNGPMISGLLLGNMFNDLDEATKAAKDRPDVIARIDQIKIYLRYFSLRFYRDNQGGQVEGNAIMDSLSRSNEYALTSFAMISQAWGIGSLVPYTHEEVEKEFQEGLKRYPLRTDIGETVRYSKDIVPIAWTPTQRGTTPIIPQVDEKGKVVPGGFQAYSGVVSYTIYSPKGEPIKFKHYSGDAAGQSFKITDDKGGEIFKDDKITPKTTYPHNIAVPKPGIYTFTYDSRSSGWSMMPEAGMLATIPLESVGGDVFNMWSASTQMFFYVPKGIKKIEYFYSTRPWQNLSAAHKVADPTGKVVKEVNVNGDWITVPVPSGMDGKVWSMQNLALGTFVFNNLPNYYAPTVDGLMVPREVAEKDGLQIRK